MTWSVGNYQSDGLILAKNGVLLASSERPKVYEGLVEAGQQEWELISVTTAVSHMWIFKRPLVEG